MDYKARVCIDESRLDAEWIGQASFFMEIVEAEAEANQQVDLLKESLEVIEAQRADSIRTQYADTKLTEKALAQQLVQDATVQKAKEQLRKAVYQQDIVSGAKKAMEHRKSALEHLVKMQLSQNRAEPTVAGASRMAVQEATARQRMEAHPVAGPTRYKVETKQEW